jgi:MFS family permease
MIGDSYTGKQRDRYLALQTMCASISATAFFALGGAAGSAGWRTPFWAYAVSLLLAPPWRRSSPDRNRPTGPRPLPPAPNRPVGGRTPGGRCSGRAR